MGKATTHCPYCGVELDWQRGLGKGGRDSSPSLDRINNEKELRLDNIEIICHRCNSTKYNRTKKEFIDYCIKIADNSRC